MPDHPRQPMVAAVVVSWNRRELLELTLRGITSGDRVPDIIIVVDNASTDDSVAFVESFAAQLGSAAPAAPVVDLIRLERNVGGAGGFTVGIDRAANHHRADLIWVMDDDTEPLPQTLAASVAAWSDYDPSGGRRPVLVASRVLWTDGTEHPMNSMIERIGAGAARRRRAAAVGGRTIRSGSFVSLVMDGDAVRAAGLPWADYFIWNDDFEYSTRLARWADAIQLPGSEVVHHTRKPVTTDVDPGARFYYDVRNKLWVFTRSQSLAPWEKALYGGATARLWLRTLRGSAQRRQVLRRLGAGARDALHPPRSSAEVLDGLWRLEGPSRSTGDRAGEPAGAGRPGAAVPALPSFSLLIPVYAGDTPARFRRAVLSSTLEQTVRPSEVVIVRDGPVEPVLQEALEELTGQLRAAEPGLAVVREDLPANRGLTAALQRGVRLCTHEVIARCDADDLSYPQRFARQLPLIADGADLVGSSMHEIDDREAVLAVRDAPVGAERILAVSRLRNPVSHPTVVFRRRAVEGVGGYQHVPQAEDYWLWVRMLRAGGDVRNIDEPLVGYRVSDGAYARRGGLQVFQAELQLQARLRGIGHIGPLGWARNVAVRGGYRFIPRGLRERCYRALVRQRSS